MTNHDETRDDSSQEEDPAVSPLRILIQSKIRVGPYKVVHEIARGGQGVVYRAVHEGTGERAALKVLLSGHEKQIRRFRQEAQVLERLQHPNLPKVFELGKSKVGQLYQAVELIVGSDLHERVERSGPPAPGWSASVLKPVAAALHYCHDRGVIHRDLKPANIMVEEGSGRPVLMDFGLIKRDADRFGTLSQDALTRLSVSGEMKGTPAFMAPEQADPKTYGKPTPRSDVYGLGATLYFLLTGAPPFFGGTAYSVVLKLLRNPPPDPREARPDTPDALAELCLAAMAKVPAERPDSARAFARRLGEAASSRSALDVGGGWTAKDYVRLGISEASSKNLERAIQLYDRAISLDPRYPKAYLNRGSALAERGDAIRAAQDFEESLRLKPEQRQAKHMRRYIEKKLGRKSKY